MINATCLDVATKLQNCKKNAFTICLCYSHMFRCSYKTSKLQKNAFTICLCYSHMFRCSYKTRKTTKKGIDDICGTSCKTRKSQKNIHVTIYIHIIHVRLDIALMEGNLYPLWFPKNIHQPVQLIASLTCAETYHPNIHQPTEPWTSLLWVGPILGTQKTHHL